MTISASMVKELRERTGAGMMECKAALVETGGDLDAAADYMRKQGLAKADKKASRVAAEGRISVARKADSSCVAMVEVNCETDFVSSGADFVGFTEKVAGVALASAPAELSALMGLTVEGATVEHQQKTLIAKIGEKISVRRFAVIPRQGSHLGVYLHGTRIGVVVDLKGGSEELARDLAMHVAASKPTCISADQVPTELVAKEREILEAQSKDSGKPADIIAKMVEGRIRKYMAEITLLGQPFVKDPDLTVEKLLKQAGAQVLAFYRFEVGEGIEKKSEDFAAEVMAQVRGS